MSINKVKIPAGTKGNVSRKAAFRQIASIGHDAVAHAILVDLVKNDPFIKNVTIGNDHGTFDGACEDGFSFCCVYDTFCDWRKISVDVILCGEENPCIIAKPIGDTPFSFREQRYIEEHIRSILAKEVSISICQLTIEI